jgi:hypothetical protein
MPEEVAWLKEKPNPMAKVRVKAKVRRESRD